MSNKRRHAPDLRGITKLAIAATKGVTDIVHGMHVNIASGPAILGRPLAAPARALTAPIYAAIQAITNVVGIGLDVALAQLEPLLGESAPGPEREAVLAALDGVVGDTLAETGNPLAIAMSLRRDGRTLDLEPSALREALPDAAPKLLVLVHGSCMNDLQWCRRGHDHGAILSRDLGYTPVYVHYNSGLHVSTNGRQLTELLEQAARAWPVPIEEIAILGFSMGGLVTRSACRAADAGHAWRGKLTDIIFLGTPHHGAPLERGGHGLQLLLGISAYSAPLARLGKIRSAGVTDLRFGNVLDEDWHARDRFAHGDDVRTPVPLPRGVRCYAIAASTTPPERQGGRLAGDGLVPVDSALGKHVRVERTLAFPPDHLHIVRGLGHLDLLDSAEALETMRGWLSLRPRQSSTR
jgi:hypothetical protein